MEVEKKDLLTDFKKYIGLRIYGNLCVFETLWQKKYYD